MLKYIKKAIALVTVLTVSATLFLGIGVSAASSFWTATSGNPALNDLDDGYTYVRVDAGAPAATNDKYDFEENSLFIRNFDLPEKTYWGIIGFTEEPSGSANTSRPDDGFLALMIKGNDSNTNNFQLFFWNGSAQLELGNINRSENLFLRFVKLESGYALQVNERLITHDYITRYCNKGYHKNARISAFAFSYMVGDFKVMKSDWSAAKDTKMPAIYKSAEGMYSVRNADGGKVYSDTKIDFATQAFKLDNCTLENGKRLTLGFDADESLAKSEDFTLGFEQSGGEITVYAGSASIGKIPAANKIELSFSKKNNKYAAVVNGKVLNTDNAINNVLQKGREYYITATLPEAFSADFTFAELFWSQFAGPDGAVITLNDNNANHVELTTGQNVKAPGMYDLFTTGITISNLDIPDSASSAGGAYIYFGKTLEKSAPCAASEDAITLLIEKTAGNVTFYLLNSDNGARAPIGTMPAAKEYNISFSLVQKSRTLRVNDTHFRLNKLKGEASALVAGDIDKFLGYADENLVYIGLSAEGYAKADVSLFEFVRPVIPTGVSVYSDKKVSAAKGDDESGYTAKSSKEAYLVTNTVYEPYLYALNVRLNSVKGAVYFALSTTDVSDTSFYVCGDGKKVNRFGFVITPTDNNTKARIAYYGADGVKPVETVIDTVEFDWTGKHSFDVRKSENGNWYLYIDGAALNKVSSKALNDFMTANEDEELFYIFGGKSGIDISLFKLINQPVSLPLVEKEGWTSYASNGKTQLEKGEDGDYAYPQLKSSVYCFRNGTEDITKTSVKIKINELDELAGKRFVYFALSATSIVDDTKVSPEGAIDTVQRVTFRMKPDFDGNKLSVYSFNDSGAGDEKLLATLDFDFSAAHTFDVRLCSDNNWYFCVDNVVIKDAKCELLNHFLDKYPSRALYYGIGAFGVMNAQSIAVVKQAPANVHIDTETWYAKTIGSGPLEGNDTDGYSLQRDCQTFVYSDQLYDATNTAVNLRVNDVAGWLYFSLVKSDYDYHNGTSFLPRGQGDSVHRVVLIVVPISDSAQFQYWCADGESSTPTIITAFNFDWFGKSHVFDVRQSEDDGNWYFCVDGRMLMNKISATLNQFMKANAGEELRYCIGGQACLGVSELKIVDKPDAIQSEDGEGGFDSNGSGSNDDFGFELEFDNLGNDDEDETDFEINDDSPYIDTEPEIDTQVEEIDPLDYLQKVKVKKRRLVSAAHGIIFTKLEIAAMIAGGVAIIAAGSVLVIFLIKKIKRKSRKRTA